MDYNEIIKALVLIRDICANKSCCNCPFSADDETCCITENGSPAYWIMNEVDCWRAFK